MFTRLEGFSETPAWSCLLLDWPSLCLCCHRLVVTKPRGSGDKNDHTQLIIASIYLQKGMKPFPLNHYALKGRHIQCTSVS